MAYQIAWADKTVLFSGRFPVKPSGAAVQKLLSDLPKEVNLRDCLHSLDRLNSLKPAPLVARNPDPWAERQPVQRSMAGDPRGQPVLDLAMTLSRQASQYRDA